MYRYTAIEGNIGSGKTSLATRLAADLKATLILEEFADNPFLPRFYEQPERYAFPVELSFLSERFSQLRKELLNRDLFSPAVVSDYFIPKCQIFAKNNLADDEYDLFMKVYHIVEGQIPRPDLLVYLFHHTSRLLENVRKRGRTYERHITAQYLDAIHERYMAYIAQHRQMRVLVVDANELDFVNRADDYLFMRNLVLKKYPPGITRVVGRTIDGNQR